MKHFYVIFLLAIVISCDKKEEKKEPIQEVKNEVVKEKKSEKKDSIVEVVKVEEVKEPVLIYVNQVAADKKPIARLEKNNDVKVYNENGWYKYRIGEHTSYRAAKRAQASLLEVYDDVFVQALLDGKPIVITDAIKREASKK